MTVVSFSGIASGIDSTALIRSLIDQQRSTRVRPLETAIASREDRRSTFGELKSLLSKLRTTSATFRTIEGGGLAKLAASSDESVANATANGGASNSALTVNVTQLARNATQSFNDRFASTSSSINSSINNGAALDMRQVTYTIGTGGSAETVNVEVTNATTLDAFVTSFNAQSQKATAAVVNLGTTAAPSFGIVVTSNQQGTSEGQIAVSVGGELTSKGAFNGSTISQATNAAFTVSGISGSISRSSNTVTDVIPGVTLSLQRTGSTTIAVSDDAEASASRLQELVDSFNAVVSLIRENDAVTSVEENGETRAIFGPLSDTSLDDGLLAALREGLSGLTGGGLVSTLADLGVTTQRDGSLLLDSGTFESALSKDSSGARSVLESLGERFGALGGTIDTFTRFNGIIDLADRADEEDVRKLQTKIADIERGLLRQEETLTQRFARLESLVGRLTSQQANLTSLLPR